ncbi:hypothetical protein [Aggregatilinea lenta]|uniref:hypothetical protein n=1 Tax=Aggregatilinea lenta TaxID=913108 RepID=UPI0013C3133F|nr:hypothetical protein [Aggregatilinea lenta]
MENVLALLSVAAPLALIYGLYVMAQISQRFGAVTKRPPYYRWFYVSMALMLLPVVMRLLAPGMGDDGVIYDDSIDAFLVTIPLVLSLALALGTAWRYWDWLIHSQEEAGGPAARTPQRRR